MEHTDPPTRPAWRGYRRWGAAAVVLTGGLVLAACGSSSPTSSPTTTTRVNGTSTTATTTPAATGAQANAALGSALAALTASTNATYSATYNVSTTATGANRTVTYAQSPPKEVLTTPAGTFYVDGATISACKVPGTNGACTALPRSLDGVFNELTTLLSPRAAAPILKGIQAEAARGGVTLSSDTGTFGGVPSTCTTANSHITKTSFQVCVADSTQVVTHFDAFGQTGTLTAYSPSPPSTAFTPTG